MSIHVETCRGCGSGLIWLKHERTGKASPITMKIFADGNIAIDEARETYRIVPAAERAALAGQLHKNHFSDCPNAKEFKR